MERGHGARPVVPPKGLSNISPGVVVPARVSLSSSLSATSFSHTPAPSAHGPCSQPTIGIVDFARIHVFHGVGMDIPASCLMEMMTSYQTLEMPCLGGWARPVLCHVEPQHPSHGDFPKTVQEDVSTLPAMR